MSLEGIILVDLLLRNEWDQNDEKAWQRPAVGVSQRVRSKECHKALWLIKQNTVGSHTVQTLWKPVSGGKWQKVVRRACIFGTVVNIGK